MRKQSWWMRRLLDGRNRALISEDGKTVCIQLTMGKCATIDASDWPLVKHRRWSAMKHLHRPGSAAIWNAVTTVLDSLKVSGIKKVDLMHRVIMGYANGDNLSVERLNTKDMDFRRSNLRVVDGRRTNGSNRRKQIGTRWGPCSSKYLGVMICRSTRPTGKSIAWQARICYDGRQRYLGCFPYTNEGERAAAARYDEEARLHQPSGRTCNFPQPGDTPAF